MRFFLLLTAFLTAITTTTSAQGGGGPGPGPGGVDQGGFFRNQTRNIVYEKELIGRNYLYEDWLLADLDVRVDSGHFENTLVKIDLKNAILEVKIEDSIYVLPSQFIKKVEFNNKQRGKFTSRNEIDLLGPIGFYQILFDQDISLYIHHYTKVKQADYNVIFDTGSKDDIIELKKAFYLKSNEQLVKLDTNKKRLASLFNNSEPLENFIKKNKLKVKTEADFVKIASFLNQNISQLDLKKQTFEINY